MDNKALSKAIEIVGSQAELARRVGGTVKQAHVWNWLHRERIVPADCVLAVAGATEWRVTPHQLRADIYPHPFDGLPSHLRTEQAAA